jgi:glutathione synthase
VEFGSLAVARGVIVVNDPDALARSMNKLYLQQFPPEVRPVTIVTRHADDVRGFLGERHDKIIVKPLQGSGGHGVFLVREDEHANLNQIFDAVSRDGYVIAQEYLPEAAAGDIRVFVMNGRILERDSKCAAFRRVNQSGDVRSNMHVGGHIAAAEVTDEIRHLVELVRPRLVQDGMFLVGLDVVGSKLMEINVFSPGGFGSVEQLTGHDFAPDVIAALERKVDVRASGPGAVSNASLATS